MSRKKHRKVAMNPHSCLFGFYLRPERRSELRAATETHTPASSSSAGAGGWWWWGVGGFQPGGIYTSVNLLRHNASEPREDRRENSRDFFFTNDRTGSSAYVWLMRTDGCATDERRVERERRD